MRTSTAYFTGVGTVVIAVAAGLGGGYLAANIVSPHEQTVSKLERRMSAAPIPVTTAPSEPVPYVAAPMTAAADPVATPARVQPQTPAQTQPQTGAAAPPSANAPAEEKTANNSAAEQPATPATPPSKPTEQAGEKTAAPQDAFAKARDVDIKRAAVEKRRAERRQRWEDKRRFRQPREQELEAVEERVREETESRQVFAVEPVRTETPRIRLFDLD
jgi:hypothetical protein